jgi:hypothetical protein
MYTTGYYVGDVYAYLSSDNIYTVVLWFVVYVLLFTYKERYSLTRTFMYAVIISRAITLLMHLMFKGALLQK